MIAALVTALAWLFVTFLVGASIAAVLIAFYHLSKLVAARRDKREREARRVITGVDLIKTQPSEPPDDDELIGARPVHIARSPLARHRSTEHATTSAGYQPRHAIIGTRDPLIAARLESTQLFAERIEWEMGEPLDRVGPREKELICRRIAWTPVQPIAEQLALDLTGVAS